MDEPKIELIGLNEKLLCSFQLKYLLPSVKHGGDSIMAWACFAASWPGQPAIIVGSMNSELYQRIIKENVRTSVKEQSLKRTWVMQQDNNPKHKSFYQRMDKEKQS